MVAASSGLVPTHTAAELRGDAATLLRTELLLREQAEALPPVHPDRAGYLEYLGGEGLLNLNTLPAGASVAWHRYVPHGRRLVAEFERELRPTPLRRAWLPRGSHLIVLRAAGCAEVRYPVAMDRLGFEAEAIGFHLTSHPLDAYEATLKA